MFSFYEFNITNVVIIFVITFILFITIDMFQDNEKKNRYLNGSISLFVGILVSICFSYLTLESDNLLTENYWA